MNCCSWASSILYVYWDHWERTFTIKCVPSCGHNWKWLKVFQNNSVVAKERKRVSLHINQYWLLSRSTLLNVVDSYTVDKYIFKRRKQGACILGWPKQDVTRTSKIKCGSGWVTIFLFTFWMENINLIQLSKWQHIVYFPLGHWCKTTNDVAIDKWLPNAFSMFSFIIKVLWPECIWQANFRRCTNARVMTIRQYIIFWALNN